MTPKLKSKMEQMASLYAKNYADPDEHPLIEVVRLSSIRSTFSVGFITAYDILMPIIERQREALVSIAGIGITFSNESNWVEICGNDMGIAKQALEATKESLG